MFANSSAPGKLMLAGEWAVLEKEVPCIVLAVNKRVNCVFRKASQIIVSAKDIGLKNRKAVFKKKLEWLNLRKKEKQKVLFVEKAIETSLQYLQNKGVKLKPFKLEIKSSISLINAKNKKQKIGFGSSAAVTVSVVAGIMAFHGQPTTSFKAKKIVFKLAALSHFFAQKKIGSCFDVAASTFGGAIKYTAFDSKKIVEMLKKNGLNKTVKQKWPLLSIKKIVLPENLFLCVAFTGKSASTKNLVKKVFGFKKKNPEKYFEIIKKIKKTVLGLEIALNKKDKKKVLEYIKKNRVLLKELSHKSKANLETRKLKILSDLADLNECAGKFSGAGGGDNGIALCFSKKNALKLKRLWKQKGLIPLQVKIDCRGVKTKVS